MTCREALGGASKSNKACSAILQVVDQKQNSVIFSWIIGRNAEGALVTVLQSPTGILIQKGVELKIDNGKARLLNYSACITQHCESTLVMDDSFNREAIAGQNATATIYGTDGQGININFPLKGIAQAMESIGR